MKKFIGDRAFYIKVMGIAIPIVIQNGITNFVSLLDNIMVGQIGTEQMSGVAIINQLFFVFYLALFGAVSGAGIFTVQYVGQKNNEGVRYTMRIKLLVAVVISLMGILLLLLAREPLISLFLHEQGDGIDPAATLSFAESYLFVMLTGILPFGITQAYVSTLRESGETVVPMTAGLTAVIAACATVISRFVELAIVVIWTHLHKDLLPFAEGLYSGFGIPLSLLIKILIKGTPLFLNELLWSAGMTALTQCYSTRGLAVVAAFNISGTIVNLFNVFMISMGAVVSIMIGQILGSGDMSDVVDTDHKLIAFSVALSTVLAVLLIIVAPVFPRFYNTSDEIRHLAATLMTVAAAFMPVSAFLNSAYFTIRSGGRTVITFLFDSAYLWVICWPVALFLSRYTDIDMVRMYIVILSLDFIKVLVGYIMLKKRIWIRDLVGTP